jgi:cobalt-zinc-cadmium efflux system outer membrane protein
MKWLAIILCFAVSPRVLGRELSYEEATSIALENNVDLRALRLQSISFREKSRQALSPNSPVLSLSRNDLPGLDPNETPGNEQYTIAYTLGFPGKAFLQSASFKHLGEAAREDAYGKEIELMAQIFNNMAGQQANHQLGEMLQGEIKKAKDLIRLQETRYSLGQGSQADILNAKVALSKLQQDELNNRNEYISLENDFYNLLGNPAESSLQAKSNGEPVYPNKIPGINALRDLMEKNKPGIKSADSQVGSSESLVSAASLQALPDVQLSLGMNNYKIPAAAPIAGLTRDYNMGISVTLPIFFPINEWSGIRAARADRDVAQARRDSIRFTSRSELISTYTNFHSSRLSLEQMQSVVIPAAHASYQLTLSSYSRGKVDYLRLADARSTFIQAEKDLNAKKRQLAQAFYQLIQNVGCDFTKQEGPHACQ